jgi:hypothetical protein
VLDFAHAAEYLADAAKATWADAATVTTWVTTQRHELLTGDPDQVLAVLEQLPPSDGRDTALGYLTARRTQIAYRDFVARGWPIGSGCVESAHQHVVQDRLKGRGMRWTRAGAEALVAFAPGGRQRPVERDLGSGGTDAAGEPARADRATPDRPAGPDPAAKAGRGGRARRRASLAPGSASRLSALHLTLSPMNTICCITPVEGFTGNSGRVE